MIMVPNEITIGSIVITGEMMTNLFKAIGRYVGTSILGMTGTSIYKEVYGNQVKDLNTDELYCQITKIVKDENKRQSIYEKMAVVSAANSFYLIDYTNKVTSTSYSYANIKEKEEDLERHLISLTEAISFFSTDYVKENAINEFVLGSAVALMYYKELAIITGGITSPNYTTYITYLKKYYEHAKQVSEKMLSDRTTSVTAVERHTAVVGGDPYAEYCFDDKFENKHYTFDAVKYGEKKAKELAENKRKELIDSFKEYLKPTTDAMKEWEQLIEKDNIICTQSDAYGDVSTNYFDDISIRKEIKKLQVNYGCIIDGITIVYEDDTYVHHGGYGGTPVDILLDTDDYITQIDGYIENWDNHPQRAVSMITFKTKKGRIYGPYGHRPYANYKYAPIDEKNLFTLKNGNKKILALYGNNANDDNFICRLGVYWE